MNSDLLVPAGAVVAAALSMAYCAMRSKGGKGQSSNVIREKVGTLADFPEGKMKAVKLGEGRVIVVNQKGKLSAVGSKCPHYGGGLAQGVLSNGRIICPLHGAGFNAVTGDIEEGCSADPIPAFDVIVQGQDVIVVGEADAIKASRRLPTMCSRDAADSRTFVVIGGGAAGAAAVDGLREAGFKGEIVMICRENNPPYDRVKGSKVLGPNIKDITLRDQSFYQNNDVELLLGVSATGVNAQSKTVSLSNGRSVNYDKLLIATGGDPRRLPGDNLDGVFCIRNVEDSVALKQAVETAKHAVCVGSSFIGMEAAALMSAYLEKDLKSLHVIGMEKVPFERVMGSEIGQAMQTLHESKGVQFRMEATVKEFKSTNGKLTSVILTSGEELPADVVVIGAGCIPVSPAVSGSKGKIERDNSLVVNEHMQWDDDIYVAGDIARFPWFVTGDMIRVEHWGYAQLQGRVAAYHMAGVSGDKSTLRSVPFFWTVQYGRSLRYAGHANGWDEIVFDGSAADLKFVAYFVRANKVIAVASLMRDPQVAAAAELMRDGKMPSVSAIKKGGVDLTKYL